MKDYNIDNLTSILKSNSATVVLFGAGDYGKLALYALKTFGIQVSYFCDSDERKWGKLYCGVKTIFPKELLGLKPDTHIFICNNYIISVSSLLKQMNIANIYSCTSLLENTDFSKTALGIQSCDIQRKIAFHKRACLNADNITSGDLNIACIDIVVTERCSLKCRDCSNLMQYYVEPRDCDLNLLLKSVDKIMECIGWLYEFRVLGGEPFVNKQLHKVINELVKYENVGNVVVYTNGTIIPRGEYLLCLKSNKVRLEITNYGDISKKYSELIETLKAYNIAHITNRVSKWDDCGSIQYHQRTTSELTHMFRNCCMNDVITLLHGKLYRCPFSAHAINLNAIPIKKNEVIDFSDENTSLDDLKYGIKQLYNNSQYINACNYCNGRDYNSLEIEAAVQVKDPLLLNVYSGDISNPQTKE